MEDKKVDNREDDNKEKEGKKYKDEGIKKDETIKENKKSENEEQKIALNSENTLTNIFQNSNQSTNLDNLEIKNFIYNHWNIIEPKIDILKKEECINFEIDNYEIRLYFHYARKEIILIRTEKNKEDSILRFNFSIFSRKIKFQKLNEVEIENMIYSSEDIEYYINKYQFNHPLYTDPDDNKNKTVYENNINDVLKDKRITFIFDDEFLNFISKNNFIQYKYKGIDKISNLYINKPKDNISEKINNDCKIISKNRDELSEKLIRFERALNKQIFFLSGGKGIGKTITLLTTFSEETIVYFNIKIIKPLESKDKKKIIYSEFMHLFRKNEYQDYYDFYKYISKVKGFSNNIWKLFNSFCNKISNYAKIKNPIIIIDDYDDIFMNKDEIMNLDIINENLINPSNGKIKFIICGNGNFINNLMFKYITKILYNNQFEIAYYNDLDLNEQKITNLFYEVDKNKCKNDIEEYLKKIYNSDKNKISFNIILYEELVKLKYIFCPNDILLTNIPIQFFKIIHFENNLYFTIDYQYPELINFSNSILKSYIYQKINIEININEEVQRMFVVHGLIEERLIIGLFESNQLIDDFNIPEENVLNIDKICEINEYNVNMKPGIKDNFPILIKQIKEGADFDFTMILEKNKDIFGLLIQVGLNKKKCEISKVFINFLISYENLIKGLRKLTGKNITKLSLLFIFDKEKQEYNENKLNELNELIKQLKEKKNKNHNEESKLKDYKKAKYKYYIGKQYTKELKIPYLEFSPKTNKLYSENEEIKSTERFVKFFWPITDKLDNIIYLNTKTEFSNIFKDDITILKNQFPDSKNIYHFKILKELNDYKEIIENLSLILFIIIFFKEKLIIIFKKEIKEKPIYLEYQNKKFKEINRDIVNNLMNDNNNKFHIYLCEKIFYNEKDLETYIGPMKVTNVKYKEPEKKKKSQYSKIYDFSKQNK